MAGEKLSPRQKMIGMMYLVLTALLALQVSNSVLEKFVFINRVMEKEVNEGAQKNSRLVSNIQSTVKEKGDREEDLNVLKRAREVRERSSEVVGKLEDYKQKIVELTGGTDENGNYIGVKDQDKVANMMINKGQGEEIKKLLNNYADFLSKETGDKEYPPLAMDAWENPVFKDDPNQNSKDFSALTFQNTPMAAGLASISQLQAEVINYETDALTDLAEQVGAQDISFDQITVMVRPESKIVAAGAKYKADMFIAASSSAINPEMYVDEKPVPVEGQFGKVEFTATGGNYDNNGFIQKSFKAAIQLPNVDTPFVENIEYTVVKPTIKVQSAAVQALYLRCGNELQVDVPQLGADYNPSFSATGAQVLGGDRIIVTVVPQRAKVALKVSSSGNYIGTEDFRVRRVPKPTIELKTRGKHVDEKRGMSAPGPRSLDIEAVPEEDFKTFLPKDARYRVSQWTVTLARGSRPIGSKNVTDEKVNLNDFASKARPGDRIVVEVKQVQRMNFQRKVEEVPLGTVVKTIPLH